MIWRCKKCGCALEISDSQSIDFCPNCGFRTDKSPAVSITSKAGRTTSPQLRTDRSPLGAPCPLPGKTTTPCRNDAVPDDTPASRFSKTSPAGVPESSGKNPDSVCPICCSPITDSDVMIICPDCKVPYHQECWDSNQGCATYGCKSAQCLGIHASRNGAETLIPCPWCQTLLSPKTVVCSNCGKRTDLYSSEPPLDKKIVDIIQTIKSKLSLLFRDMTRFWVFLRPYILLVLRSYKNSLMAYAKFKGKTSRRDFAFYALVFLLVSILLIKVLKDLCLAYIFWGATALPSIAVMARRLHDAGLSAWYICAFPVLPLLLFVPTDKSIKNNEESNNTKIEQG